MMSSENRSHFSASCSGCQIIVIELSLLLVILMTEKQ